VRAAKRRRRAPDNPNPVADLASTSEGVKHSDGVRPTKRRRRSPNTVADLVVGEEVKQEFKEEVSSCLTS
jgi:hypothetical protein